MSVDIRKRQKDDSTNRKRKQFAIPKSTNPIKDGVSECFQKFTTSLYISLAPCHLNNPVNGIKAQHLDPLVMSYFPKAQGVVLSYSNIKISDDNITHDTDGSTISIAKVSSSSPFSFFWISVDLLIWRPQLGDVLEGYIYMQTASHIGLLLHDTFNASIKKYNIPNDWNFIPSQIDEFAEDENEEANTENKHNNGFKSFGYWVDENEVKIEGKLKFTVKSIHTTGRVVSVEGTLITPGAEKDSQPVSRERRSSSSNITLSNQHKTFNDDDEDIIPTVSEIPEPKDDDVNVFPAYTKESDDDQEEDADGVIVNRSDSDDENSD